MRLIANGRELSMSETLLTGLGEFYFHSKCITLKELDVDACREWQRSGRCTSGSKCPHKHTHTIDLSPRYVGHANSPQSTSPVSSPPGTPPKIASPRQQQPSTTKVCRN